MNSLIVLFEHRPTGRGTSAAIRNFEQCLKSQGFEVRLCYLRGENNGAHRVDGALEITNLGIDGQRELEDFGCTLFYWLTPGNLGTHFVNPKFTVINHVVFPILAPLIGQSFYVSKWLSENTSTFFGAVKATLRGLMSFEGWQLWLKAGFKPPSKRGYLNHIVPKVQVERGLRETLGIPETAFVITSLSDPSQFDVPWAKEALFQLLEEESSLYFLGRHLGDSEHPRVLSDFRYRHDELGKVLGAVNLTVFARRMGESFGMGIAESVSAGIPVLAWSRGRDRNHLETLGGNEDSLFESESDLRQKILQKIHNPLPGASMPNGLQLYSCEAVLAAFIDLTLNQNRDNR